MANETKGSVECSRCGRPFGPEVPVCCSAETYDDGSHRDALCTHCCGPHPRAYFRGGNYDRMDCDQ